jgi:Fe-S cluster biogenesis protein NfuA
VRVAEVESVLLELRPAFVADGGDIALTGVADDGRVTVRLVGACNTCYSSSLTLRGALEPRLRERLSWFSGLDAE